MKKCKDGIEVPSRCYYYLLDWNDINNKQYLWETFHKDSLCDLTSIEFWQLWKHATESELTK